MNEWPSSFVNRRWVIPDNECPPPLETLISWHLSSVLARWNIVCISVDSPCARRLKYQPTGRFRVTVFLPSRFQSPRPLRRVPTERKPRTTGNVGNLLNRLPVFKALLGHPSFRTWAGVAAVVPRSCWKSMPPALQSVVSSAITPMIKFKGWSKSRVPSVVTRLAVLQPGVSYLFWVGRSTFTCMASLWGTTRVCS